MILSEPDARAAALKVLGRVKADDAVLSLAHRREATTRFANNGITQNVATERFEAVLTVAFGQRKGTAQVGSFEDESLAALVARAEGVARAAPPDPEFLPSAGPQEFPKVRAWFERTARLDADSRAALADRVIGEIRGAGMRAAGTVEISENGSAVATRNGFFGYHAQTDAEIGCTATAEDSSGWARDVGPDGSLLDPARIGRTAAEQAARAAHPRPVSPGRYDVVLAPPAIGALAMHLIWWANARTTEEGLTYLSGKVGQRLAGGAIALTSDPADPRLPCRPFDGEGTPRRRTAWVEGGAFRGLWWDRFTAKRSGVEPVPFPGPVRMAGTERSAEELIRSVARGILVTHFWYIRSVKEDETLVTGMTRDGTFWIEGGEVRHGVRNLRFNESCLGALQRAAALGRPEACTDVEVPPSIFPPVVVKDFNFVSAADF